MSSRVRTTELTLSITAEQRCAVIELVERVTADSGTRPLSDDAWIALRSSDAQVVAVLLFDEQTVVGVCLVHGTSDEQPASCELVISSALDYATAAEQLLRSALASNPQAQWWAFNHGAVHAKIADDCGLVATRLLLQMTVPLPLAPADDPEAQLATRAFRPGVDDDAWLEVNRRAFAWHPEQGRWTDNDLRQRIAEPWFDADGFLLHERDARLAGFCWTKVHNEVEPTLGEIYVIAVDPDYVGRGLGRALTVAGLNWLASQGIALGMLFVDGDNTAAVALYQRLGFTIARTDVLYATREK